MGNDFVTPNLHGAAGGHVGFGRELGQLKKSFGFGPLGVAYVFHVIFLFSVKWFIKIVSWINRSLYVIMSM